MFSSKDQELLQFRRVRDLPTDVRFFLAEHQDGNLYHYGVLDPQARPSREAAIASARVAATLGYSAKMADTKDLDRLLARRCVERSGSTRGESYWLSLVELVRSPAVLAENLEREGPERFSTHLDDLATLLHIIPQSCKVGVMRGAFLSTAGMRRGSIKLGPDAPWTDTESTLSLLRPLEYIFGIGNPKARQATVHILYGPKGFFQGTVLNFSSLSIQDYVLEQLEQLLETLCIKELSNSIKALSGEAGLFGALARSCQGVLPAFAALHWTEAGRTPRLAAAFGRPWQRLSSEPSDLMSTSGKIGIIPDDHLRWLRLRAQGAIARADRDRVASSFGYTVCDSLPNWELAGGKGDPVGPTLCTTTVSVDEKEVLQLLLAPMGNGGGSNLEKAAGVHDLIETARLLALDVTTDGRYSRGAVGLPTGWVYHPTTTALLEQAVVDFQRAWSGVQGARAPVLLLLCGAPGTGKSWIAKNWLAKEVIGDRDPLEFTGSALLGEHLGETQKNIRAALKNLLVAGPRALLIDEIGQISHEPTGEVTNFTVSEAFKNELGGVIEYAEKNPRSKIALIGTTNYFEKLDAGIKARFLPIYFEWTGDELQELVNRLITIPWSNEARALLLEVSERWRRDPRRTRDLISMAQSRAVPEVAFGNATVDVSIVRKLVAGFPDWEAREAWTETLWSLTGPSDLQRLASDLRSVLELAKTRLAADKRELFLLSQEKGINPNNIHLLRSYFPRWAKDLDCVLDGNRKIRRQNGSFELE